MKFIQWRMSGKIFLLMALLVLLQPSQHACSQANAPTILVLNSYHPGYIFSDQELQGLKSQLPPETEYFIEYMDAKRISGNDTYTKYLYDIYKLKYANAHFDLIVSFDNDALNFLRTYYNDLFPGTPVVFCGVNEFTPDLIEGYPLFTGVSETFDIESTLRLSLMLHPASTSIWVITDNTTTGKINRARLEAINASAILPVQLHFFDETGQGLTLDELLAALRRLPPNSVVYLSDFLQGRDGKPYDPLVIMPKISQASPAPVYVSTYMYIGYGAVGGKVDSGLYQGEAAGQIAARILAGEPVSAIPVQFKTNRYTFDAQQLRRWNISTTNLPPNSILLNQPLSPLLQYRQYIAGIAIFLILQTAVIFGLSISIRNRRKAEWALRASEQRYRDLIENTSDWIWELDGAMHYTYTSPQIYQILGYRPDEVLGHSPFDFLDPNQSTKTLEDIKNCYQYPHACQTLQSTWLHKDGHAIVLETNAVPLFNANLTFCGYRGISRDITERQHAQQRIEQERRLLRTVLDHLPDAVYVKDQQGRVKLTNQADLHFIGLPESEVIGQTNAALFPPETVEILNAGDEQVLRAGQNLIDQEQLLRNNQGQQRWLLTSKVALHDENGHVIGLVGIGRDITRQKQELFERQASLERSAHQQAALLNLARSSNIASGNLTQAVAEITEQVAQALQVERVSLWLVSEEEDQLKCIDLYQRSLNCHKSGGAIFVKNYPRYFAAFHNSLSIAADDALHDPRTNEFAEQYLIPLHITSMLDALIRVSGKMAGILCVEHIGPLRNWQPDEIRFASEAADQAAQAILNAQRQRSERARRESEARLRSVFEAASNVAFIITDLNIYDPHILEFSPGAEHIFGYTRQEMLQQPVARLHLPETIQNFPNIFAQIRQRQGGFVGELTLVRKSGETFPAFFSAHPILDENGLMYAALGISIDISLQKQMEAALRHNEQLLRSVISNTAVVVFAIDQNGKFVLSEGKGLASLGLSAGQVVGLSVFDVYAEYPHILATIRRALTGEPFKTIIEIGPLYFETWYSPMLNQENQLIGTIGVAVDITERIAQETQRQLNEQRLEAMLQLYTLSSNSAQEICEYALKQAAQISQSEIGYLAFLDGTENISRLYSWSKADTEQINKFEQTYPACITELWSQAIKQRKPILTNDAHAANPIKKDYPEGHIPIQRHINLPIFENNQVVAVLGVCNKPTDYDENDIRQLTLLMSSAWDILRRKQTEQDLKDSLSFNETVMAATPSVVFVLDLKQKRLTYVNEAVSSALGYSIAEFLERGQNYGLDWIHPEDRARLISIFQNSPQASDLDIYVYEHRIMRKDGTWRWFLGRVKALKRDERGLVQQLIGMATDITERKLAEEGLRESEEKFRAIIEQFSEGFVLVNEQGYIIEWNAANERITGIPRHEAIAMPFWELLYRVSVTERQTPERMELFRQATLKALHTGQSPQFYTPIEVILQTASGQRKYIEQTLFPIRTKDGYRIGSIISDISERKLSEERLRDSAQQLALAYDATLQGWSLALELRERETAGHSRRVVEQTLTLAQRLNVPETQLEHIRRGALLHDIGKMGIPDHILLKDGPLSPEEWAIMRQHPIFAYRLLQNIPYLRPALEIPYSHHERWDGSGYPQGLKGEEIPLSARIFAVVDVWDALTSDRPYKPAWSAQSTRQFLMDNAGKLFDPRVVKEYLQMLDEQNQKGSAEPEPN